MTNSFECAQLRSTVHNKQVFLAIYATHIRTVYSRYIQLCRCCARYSIWYVNAAREQLIYTHRRCNNTTKKTTDMDSSLRVTLWMCIFKININCIHTECVHMRNICFELMASICNEIRALRFAQRLTPEMCFQ